MKRTECHLYTIVHFLFLNDDRFFFSHELVNSVSIASLRHFAQESPRSFWKDRRIFLLFLYYKTFIIRGKKTKMEANIAEPLKVCDLASKLPLYNKFLR